MSDLAWGVAAFPALIALIFLRVPLGLAMLVIGFAGSWIIRGSPTAVLAQLKSLSFDSFSTYSLAAVPLFLLMGQFAMRGGMAKALFDAARVWIGHRPGGVAMAAVGACAGFGAICGSSLATAGAMGQAALPELRRQGYPGWLATGALAAGGTLGILIPPSVALVIYAVLTEGDIAALFLAALAPGILAVLGYMATIRILSRRAPQASRAPLSARLGAAAAVWPAAAIFIVVIGGIYAGVFTPNEGAAVGVAATGLQAWRAGGLDRDGLLGSLRAVAETAGMIYFIFLGAIVFNGFLAISQAPQAAADWIAASGLSPWTALIIALAALTLLGCVMDSLSMILLTVPVLHPILSGLDFGLAPAEQALWIGILMLIVIEIGLITPPVGLNLFVINAQAPDIPLRETYRGALPFVLSDVVRVALLLAFPALATFLPGLLS